MYGSEREFFIRYLYEYQKYSLYQICQKNCPDNDKLISKDSESIYLKKTHDSRVKLFYGYDRDCILCKESIQTEIIFINKTIFIFIESAFSNIYKNDLPKIIKINDLNFKHLCTTVHKPQHFVGIFDINNHSYLVDDLDRSAILISTNITNQFLKSNPISF